VKRTQTYSGREQKNVFHDVIGISFFVETVSELRGVLVELSCIFRIMGCNKIP
jgi:hypothetical protein